jgi:hypothetical protein
VGHLQIPSSVGKVNLDPIADQDLQAGDIRLQTSALRVSEIAETGSRPMEISLAAPAETPCGAITLEASM